ncbi:MAG TPA: TonB-dependent receptor, partial [Flavobacteriales bacterium]|nr:TonB-dependent receptor [Flavobacteriales bacterium]
DNAPLFGGASFSHAQQYGPFDLVVGGMVFGDQGYIGPERVNPDSLAVDPLRTGICGGYDQRARVNVATRWRNRKVKGLSYGINGNFMRARSSSTFIWDNTDEGLFRPKPGTITETRSQHWYVDPYVNYRGPHGMRHILRGRYYDQINHNNNNQSNASQNYYGEYQVQKKANILGETTITAGLVLNVTNSQAVLYSGDPDHDGHNTARTTAGYLQLDKRFLQERLMVSGGVRYETFKVNQYQRGQPVYRAGATWRALKATYLRASYGQGFRFPTLGERYIRTELDQVRVLPNENLDAEFSVNVEGGIKQGFRIGGFSGYVDVVAFQQDIDHYVEFTFATWAPGTPGNPLGGVGFKSVNTGGARITGLETEVAGKGNIGPVELTLLMGYTHTKPISTTPDEVYAVTATANPQRLSYAFTSSDTTDHLLKYRMRDLFRADLGVKHKRVSGGVSVRYNSHMRNIDRAFLVLDVSGAMPTGVSRWMQDHTTGTWVVDARVGYQLTPQLKASIIASNISNEVYSIRPMSVEAPRSWQVQLTAEL